MELYVRCPHCKTLILLMQNEINYTIFRHGILKSNRNQIAHHTSKKSCDFLAKNNKIHGCGKPFKLVRRSSQDFSAIKCDYI